MSLIEYEPGTTFPGVIGRTVAESSPAWPKPLRAKDGASARDGGYPALKIGWQEWGRSWL